MPYITLVVEDDVQLAIAKLAIAQKAPALQIQKILGKRGIGYILRNIPSFNKAAAINPYVVLLDLDKTSCAPLLLNEIIRFSKHPDLSINIAVHEAETWLLADRKNISLFLGISESIIDRDVESIVDPKQYLVNLSSRSKFRQIRDDMVPEKGGTVGNLYNTTLELFIRERWNISNAMANSRSLKHFVQRIVAIS